MAVIERPTQTPIGQPLPNKYTSGTSKVTELTTAPPAYALSSAGKCSTQMNRTQNNTNLENRGGPSNTWWSFALRSFRRTPLPASEKDQCIDWEYGIDLLNQAYHESTAASTSNGEGLAAVLNRRRYLHGTTYVLRALPADLTRDEILSLQAAGPANMLEVIEGLAVLSQSRLGPPNLTKEGGRSTTRCPPILQRLVATMVIQVFLVLQFLLPYVKLLVGVAYRRECEHKFARRIVRNTMRGCRKIVRGSLDLSRSASHLSQGKVERAIKCAMSWCVQGLIVGIKQGILEGVDLLEAQDAQW